MSISQGRQFTIRDRSHLALDAEEGVEAQLGHLVGCCVFRHSEICISLSDTRGLVVHTSE